MTDDALFALNDSAPEPVAPPAPQAIADWQVKQLRAALDALGTSEMTDRQRIVEEIVGRPVAALKELRYDDVRPLLEGLHARKSATSTTAGSAWDDRDEDTWIDRL
ncbi:hypothetical protein ACIA03_08365 [Nocardioides sp. NPDC051685]|uniref:hypothetical protein n=1 Tax=Nocardioides sp. NPDC051685 TaxID=3364334 RepID=UPI0037BAF919